MNLDKPCPFKRGCEDFKRADTILRATRKKEKTIAEIRQETGLGDVAIRRICARLVNLKYLDEVRKTTSIRRGKFNKNYARGVKAYINRW